MRRDEPTRHGRAADALIASYVRELLAEDELQPPAGEPPRTEPAAPPVEAVSSDRLTADAAL